MKAIVFAYHDIGCIGLLSLIKSGYDILSVITHADQKKENIFFRSVKKIALKNNIPVFMPININNIIWIIYLKKINPDILFSFYYRNILCKDILSIPKFGAFNLHGSLLPKYRGCCPLNWSIINGEDQTGVTLHRMTEKIDHGPIIAQVKVKIHKSDDAISLHKKMCNAAFNMLNNVLPEILNKNIYAMSSNYSSSSYFGKRSREDGLIDWNQPAEKIYNFIRGLSKPWPGAFSYLDNKKIIFWKAKIINNIHDIFPGCIIHMNPFIISCKIKALKIISAQYTNYEFNNKVNIHKLSIIKNKKFIIDTHKIYRSNSKKILILGINGFIGYHITKRLLKNSNYQIYGLDLKQDLIKKFIYNSQIKFLQGNIKCCTNWIKRTIKNCDIVLPLIAIARPIEYVQEPIKTFELDFEENLKIIRYCVKYKKRLIFPSTSEVYGMCTDKYFHEIKSNLITGSINKQRWIYASSKQLLDRIIWAYGKENNLSFTIFRPFNWVGSRLDSFIIAQKNRARVITQMIFNIAHGLPIILINNGKQKRCFTDISDGIEALFNIIENKKNNCNQKIINIGNPKNEYSILELAKIIVSMFQKYTSKKNFPKFCGFKNLDGHLYYGSGYQDIQHRKPNIDIAKTILNWNPIIPIHTTISYMLKFFLQL